MPGLMSGRWVLEIAISHLPRTVRWAAFADVSTPSFGVCPQQEERMEKRGRSESGW